jgi:glucose-1-phosphate adenylyltransferase
VNSYATVEDSVLLAGVDVGRGARIRRAIVDKGVRIPPGERIGYDPETDRARFTITEAGIVVLPKEARF